MEKQSFFERLLEKDNFVAIHRRNFQFQSLEIEI